MTTLPRALIVAGPTASGKSALAIAIAERLGGTIINTDSMQVYRELRVLTARPTPDEEAKTPHRLYGIRSASEAGSVARWRDQALSAMDEAHTAGRLPILTGGSGMYFAALTDGLADIPDPGPEARAEARRLLAEHGPAALHASLTHVDPATAARLKPEDSQRIARAWEVWRGTGLDLAAWQNHRSEPARWRFTAILLDPPRDALRAAIADYAPRAGALASASQETAHPGAPSAEPAATSADVARQEPATDQQQEFSSSSGGPSYSRQRLNQPLERSPLGITILLLGGLLLEIAGILSWFALNNPQAGIPLILAGLVAVIVATIARRQLR